MTKGRKEAHTFFQHKLFAPQPKRPMLDPQKNLCASFRGKDAKRNPHKLFRGEFWGQKGGPKRAFLGHKKSGLLFFSSKHLLSASMKHSLLRTLLRTFTENPYRRLLRTLLRIAYC